MDSDSAAALDARATPKLTRYKWQEHRENVPQYWGIPRVETCPSCARFKFGADRSGGVRCADEILVGLAASRGISTAPALAADISLLLREGAVGALG